MALLTNRCRSAQTAPVAWSGWSNHVYNAAGTFTVTATASDDVGTYSTTSVESVSPRPSGAAGKPCRRHDWKERPTHSISLARKSEPRRSPPGRVNWGDGHRAILTSSPTAAIPLHVTHTYAYGPNTYTISATATDQLGTYAAVVNLDSAFGGTGRVTTDLGSTSDSGYAAAVQGRRQDGRRRHVATTTSPLSATTPTARLTAPSARVARSSRLWLIRSGQGGRPSGRSQQPERPAALHLRRRIQQ